jgi:hypothetical protein
MKKSRMPKIMLNYRPHGQKRLGRPLKRLLDEAETGLLRPNLCRMVIMMMMMTTTNMTIAIKIAKFIILNV